MKNPKKSKRINSVRVAKRARNGQGKAIQRASQRRNRKLAVTVNKLNVWDVLKNTKADLTISDWLSVDKTATKDLLDGIKTLRGNKNQRTEMPDGRINIAPQQVAKEPSKMVINRLDTGYRDALFDSDVSTDGYLSSEEDESCSITSSSITPFEEIGKYEELDPAYESRTYATYPYSIKRILNSSPLKTIISVNDILVEAIIDCGAATSVISASLCDKLNLPLTGDVIKVSPFDSVEKRPCNVTMNVPVKIGGYTRKEHCCVRNQDPVPMKSSNVDPRIYRKEISRDGHSVLIYPRKQEEYLILGNTFLNAYDMKIDMATNILSFPIFGGVSEAKIQCYSSEINPEAVEILSLETDKTKNQITYAEELLGEEKKENVVMDNGELNLSQVPLYLKPLVQQYSHCFAEISGFGRVKGVTHRINLVPDAKPLRAKPYKMSWAESEDLEKEIATLLKNDVIEPCLGKFTSPCFFIPKADGTNRLVIDYRALNKITEPENFVLPPLSSMVDTLAGARYYSSLDCVSGFHQLELADELSKDATGFVTPKGVWRYKTLSFGLRNAPIAFNRMMLSLFGDFVGVFLHLWVDDYLVYSATEEEHREHLRLILERCEKVNLRLKFSKCTFGASSVSYLGHTLSEQGLSPMETNVDKIINFQKPRNQDQIRSFLGTTNYYHAFIQDYAKIAKPLTSQLKKGARFTWDQACQESFDHLKQALVNAPILDYPCRDKTMILTTDASTTHLGCILSQSEDGSRKNETVIAYNSRTLSNCERNYAAVHLEALAVIWAVQKYRHYLTYKPFKLRTDSAAVAFILKPDSHKSNSKLQRWNAIMQEYDYTIEHIKGTENPSDSLSRLVTS
ncbi:hypothetical protein [Parasitella parasitica]|uniref:RNA-directed DNA polymerase n=1 Tax=Parasitella parasitica TaxID=35722 RepID=A0A0B7MZK1_9FUNG|nr:hypothetical protein [Parasitella parasitica]